MKPAGSTPEDASNVELLWPAVPRGDVDGALDWVSGVMALDVAHEDWRNIDEAPDDIRRPALRAYSHELFHFFQLATMSFVYTWATELFSLLRPVVQHVQKDTSVGDFSGLKRMISEGPALLSRKQHAAFEAHFLKLDTPGVGGLTPRALLESHAYFVGRRLIHDIKPSEWSVHLSQAPAAIYRVAFDFLAYAAGSVAAYEWFSAVAAISLCSPEPILAFERLSIALGRNPSVRALAVEPGKAPEMISFLKCELPSGCLPSPPDCSGARHPIFTGAAETLRQAADSGHLNWDELFVSPHLQIPAMREWSRIEIPIIFKPAAGRQLAIQVPSGYKETQESIPALFAMGAVGQRLTQEASSSSRAQGDRCVSRLDWLVREHQPILIDLALDDLRSGDPSQMLMLLDPNGADAQDKTKWWGRIMLRLPAEIDPTQDKLLRRVPEVRRLLTAINKQLPMAVIYMWPDYAIFEWFGCIGPEDALVGDNINVLHDGMLSLFVEAKEAILQSAESLNMNAWLVVKRLFG